MHLGRVHAILDPEDAEEFFETLGFDSPSACSRGGSAAPFVLSNGGLASRSRTKIGSSGWPTPPAVVKNKEAQRAFRARMQTDEDEDVVDNLQYIRAYAKDHSLLQGPTSPNILAFLAFDIELETRWATGERYYLKYPSVLSEIVHLVLCTEVSSSAFTAFEFARLQAGSFAEVMVEPVVHPGTTAGRVNTIVDQMTLLHPADESITALAALLLSLLPHR